MSLFVQGHQLLMTEIGLCPWHSQETKRTHLLPNLRLLSGYCGHLPGNHVFAFRDGILAWRAMEVSTGVRLANWPFSIESAFVTKKSLFFMVLLWQAAWGSSRSYVTTQVDR